ncbi:hypothetical protein [Microbacterium aurum]|nr:hypothetical protein [Microbacterium aurum]MBM7826047.1 hypothetical protein [Microbacterium aurum]
MTDGAERPLVILKRAVLVEGTSAHGREIQAIIPDGGIGGRLTP